LSVPKRVKRIGRGAWHGSRMASLVLASLRESLRHA
jgi:hypothetical protein